MSNKFYLFAQNNSGGSFHRTEKLAEYVYIEAADADEANRIAESVGIYFDGVQDGVDCGCCGDRWSRAYDESAPEPSEDVRVYRKEQA